MAIKPRKAKTDALVAIAQIKKNKIKLVDVGHDKKAKRYTNESQWLDNKEFTTLSQKRMKKGRNETPNFIKSTKKEMQEKIHSLEQEIVSIARELEDKTHDNDLLREELNAAYNSLFESEKRESNMEAALDQSDQAALTLAFQVNESESECQRLKKCLKQLYPKYNILYELVQESKPAELNMSALTYVMEDSKDTETDDSFNPSGTLNCQDVSINNDTLEKEYKANTFHGAEKEKKNMIDPEIKLENMESTDDLDALIEKYRIQKSYVVLKRVEETPPKNNKRRATSSNDITIRKTKRQKKWATTKSPSDTPKTNKRRATSSIGNKIPKRQKKWATTQSPSDTPKTNKRRATSSVDNKIRKRQKKGTQTPCDTLKTNKRRATSPIDGIPAIKRRNKGSTTQTSFNIGKRNYIGGGIINADNQCYINTTIQLFTQCPEFKDSVSQFFDQNEHLYQPDQDDKLYERLRFTEGLLQEWSNIELAKKNRTVVTINEYWLKDCFGYNKSQDCAYVNGIVRLMDKVDNDSTSFENSICFKNFGFVVKTTNTCNACQNVNEIIKKEISLPLSINKELKAKVSDLIKLYEKPRKTYDYKCDNCNSQDNEQVCSIMKPYPKYFLTTIMRYEFDGKNCSRSSIEIDFGDQLEEMKLIGIIGHQGTTTNSGHYTCLLWNESLNCWLNYNDEHVSMHDTIPQHYESRAYVLLYKNTEGDIKAPNENKTPQSDKDLVDLLSEDFNEIAINDTSVVEIDPDVFYSSQEELGFSTDDETDIQIVEKNKMDQLPLF